MYLWLLLLLAAAEAHVRLSFPPARAPALDYFSSKKNTPPCGVAKPPPGQGVRTFLLSGSVVELEWFTAVPHKGGIKLEVLNERDQPIAAFTSFEDEYNVSQSSKRVELPAHFECANCAIRLTHQATEYGNDYEFFSCADVNILKALPEGNSCLNGGTRVNGECKCTEGVTGSHCQYTEECYSDDDCGAQGVCGRGAADERAVCYCPAGRFGHKCQKESTMMRSIEEFDDAQYKMREVQDNKIFWRILNDEIEVVLRYPGNSWAAIGWKPKNAKCEPFEPSLASSLSVTTAHPLDRIFVETVRNETFGGPGDDCGPNEEFSNCPETNRACEASCDWTRFPETTPNCPRQCGPPRCICKTGFVRMTNEEEACVPFDFCDKEVDSQCPSNSTWAKCGTACEPSCSNMYDPTPCNASCEKAACTCADNYVRFEGRCIYWGDCPDIEKHSSQHETEASTITVPAVSAVVTSAPVEKMTTTTTKTIIPKICAVNETVKECGKVCEADCTSIFTRAECNECGEPACACLQGYARGPEGNCVYWGDCPTEPVSTGAPTTQSPRTTPKRSLKPKVDGDVCYGDFRYPPGCTDCDYKLSWNYLDDSDDIEFSLETRMDGNGWTGVGFNADGTMVSADMLILKSMNGRLSLHDMTSDGYGAPREDDQQDLTSREVIGTHENGVLRAQFIRRRNTGDGLDKQFDTECWKMMFPVNGGKLDASGNITIHDATPLVSDRQVCIRSCHEQKTTSTAKCLTEFRYPDGCKDEECEYTASWKYDSAKKDVLFEISSRNMGRWTGIGFSKDGQMANSDMYTGWVYEGKAYVTDRFAYGRQLPAIDPADRQDIYDISGDMVDEIQTIRFRRKVVSKDKLTDFPLDQCYYFMFPIGGGRVIAKKSSDFTNPKTPIGYHDLYQPRVSQHKICICDENGVSIATNEAPSRVRARRQATPPAQQHPMDCADVVIGSVLDGRGRVKDFWSTSKATPRPDSFYGGEDSLTSSVAFNEDGITTVAFRRKLRSSDRWDHAIRPEAMTVIWAKGADPENYQHTVGEPGRAPAKFFSSTLFKYHGKNQRGVLSIDFFNDKKTETLHGINTEKPTCTGKYSVPESCADEKCSYSVDWTSDGTVARFTVKTALKEGQWTALGFSKDGMMGGSDVVVMGVHEGSVSVTDQHMPNYGKPIVDEQQDIFDVETTFSNGRLMVNFSRQLNSEDQHDINLQKCAYLLYTPVPGVFEKNGELRKHVDTPYVSKNRVCLNTCSEVADKPTTEEPMTSTTEETTEEMMTTMKATTEQSTTQKTTSGAKATTPLAMPPIVKATPKEYVVYEETEPVKQRYGLWVRILNKEFVPDLADPQTEYYQSFTKNVVSAVDKLLESRWKGMRVSKILSYSKGSVIAEFEVTSIRDVPRPIELKSLVEENAIRGNIGQLSIEPSTVKATEKASPRVEEANTIAMYRQYIIIGASVAFLFVCLCIAGCLACKCRTRNRTCNYPIPHPVNGYQYGTIGPKKNGFENVGYAGRQYSQATTASTKQGEPSPQTEHTTPEGMGETTYQEWYSKVGSKPASQQVEEAATATRPPSAQPYVSYPNDPSGYYTLGGEHRMHGPPRPFRY